MPAASASSPRSTASRGATSSRVRIEALKAVWHRGAVDADGKTGDGAGIHVEVPQDFFRAHVEHTGPHARGRPARRRHDLPAAHRSRRAGACPHRSSRRRSWASASTIYGWRQVPVEHRHHRREGQRHAARDRADHVRQRGAHPTGSSSSSTSTSSAGASRSASSPSSHQGFLCLLAVLPLAHLQGHVPGRAADRLSIPICSTSASSRASPSIHQRYSTNTFPTWRLAQPFRMLAHNGEINTLKGNVNWMKSHEIAMAPRSFGEPIDDIKPVIQPGGSDSRGARRACSKCWCAPAAPRRWPRRMLVPEAWSKDASTMPRGASRHVCLLQRGDGAVGRSGGARADRRPLGASPAWTATACGPMRYAVTDDGLLVVGSETGMVRARRSRRSCGRAALGPGQMIARRPRTTARSTTTARSRTCWPAQHPYEEWVEEHRRCSTADHRAGREPRAARRATSCAAARSPPAAPSRISS